MRGVAIILAFVGVLGFAVAASSQELLKFEVQPNRIQFLRDGSCRIEMILQNDSSGTLNVMGDLYLVNEDGDTFASTTFMSPPALSGRRSIFEVEFYRFQLAQRCTRPVRVIAQTTICEINGEGYPYSLDPSCRRSDEKIFERR